VRLSLAKNFHDVNALDEEFAAARARGNEGLMIKSPVSLYKPSRRGRDWLKLKRAMATLDVVVTALEVGHGKRHKLFSDYTFAVQRSDGDPELLNIGKAYSGLTDSELAELTEWFRSHTLREFAHGRVRIVEPRIVIEVTFDHIQESKRHKSGYALRFPRILRLRPDKAVADIDTLETVRKLVEKT
jgi:DNA ligase 1